MDIGFGVFYFDGTSALLQETIHQKQRYVRYISFFAFFFPDCRGKSIAYLKKIPQVCQIFNQQEIAAEILLITLAAYVRHSQKINYTIFARC